MSGFKVKYSTIHSILTIVILALFYFTPLYRAQKVIIIYPLLLCWILLSDYLDRKWISRSIWVFGLLGCIVILDIVRYLFTEDITILQALITHKLLIYLWPIFLIYYTEHIKDFGKIEKVFLLMIFISAVFTTIGNIMYPEASRLLASFGTSYYQETRIMYKEKFIGGYGLIFAMAFLVMPLISSAKYTLRKWLYVMAGFFVISVIFGAYAIAIGITAISVVIAFGKNKRMSMLIAGSIIIMTLILIFKDYLLAALMNIGDMIGSPILTKRARQILYGTYAIDQGNMSRPLLYMNAVKNILDRPFLGLLTGAAKERRSDHSMLLEYFEINGIFGCIYVAMFVKTFNYIRKKLVEQKIRVLFIAWSALIAVFLAVDQFNASYELGGVFLFIGPMLFLVTEKGK